MRYIIKHNHKRQYVYTQYTIKHHTWTANITDKSHTVVELVLSVHLSVDAHTTICY